MLDNIIKILQIIFYIVSIAWIFQQSKQSDEENNKKDKE
ncbi:preprotein translocase subunit SecG [Metabacillus niabensis]|uniref:Preprotein translocase subunit SecG n=1 Tax=Metabacillus niabensis TaxID=324854 RepID=A0ABT9Z918_9BACI|nr:preprotein translocase subunit SecG [Metabacillus niabensis]